MNFDIVEIEEFSGRMAKIYSIMLDGDEMTLLDHFFDENEQFEEDLSIIAAKLKIMDKIKDVGFSFLKKMKVLQETELLHYGTTVYAYTV